LKEARTAGAGTPGKRNIQGAMQKN